MNNYNYYFGTKVLQIYGPSDGVTSYTSYTLENDTIGDIKFVGASNELPLGFLSNNVKIEFIIDKIPTGLFEILTDSYYIYTDISYGGYMNNKTWIIIKETDNTVCYFVGVLEDKGKNSKVSLMEKASYEVQFTDIMKSVASELNFNDIPFPSTSSTTYYGNDFIQIFHKGTSDSKYIAEKLDSNLRYMSFDDLFDYIINFIIQKFSNSYADSPFIFGSYTYDIPKFYQNNAVGPVLQTNERGGSLNTASMYLVVSQVDDSISANNITLFEYLNSKYSNIYDFLYDYFAGLGSHIYPNYTMTGLNEGITIDINSNLICDLSDSINMNDIELSNAEPSNLAYNNLNIVYNANEGSRSLDNVKKTVNANYSKDDFTIVLNTPTKLGSYLNKDGTYIYYTFEWLGLYYIASTFLFKVNDIVSFHLIDYLNESFKTIESVPTFTFDGDGDIALQSIEYQSENGIASQLTQMFFRLINADYNIYLEINKYSQELRTDYLWNLINPDLSSINPKFKTYYDNNTFFTSEYEYSITERKLNIKINGVKTN